MATFLLAGDVVASLISKLETIKLDTVAMKRKFICSCGTWNTPDERYKSVPAPTTVIPIYTEVAEKNNAGARQGKYYPSGVATGGLWRDKAIGDDTGKDIDRNLKRAYRELCDLYDTGDETYLFGFSRRANTVKSLVRLLSGCWLLITEGLSDGEAWRRIERVFKKGYRRKNVKRAVCTNIALSFHNAAGLRASRLPAQQHHPDGTPLRSAHIR